MKIKRKKILGWFNHRFKQAEENKISEFENIIQEEEEKNEDIIKPKGPIRYHQA